MGGGYGITLHICGFPTIEDHHKEDLTILNGQGKAIFEDDCGELEHTKLEKNN